MKNLAVSGAERLIQNLRRRRAARARRPPLIRFDSTVDDGPGRILYLSPDPAQPRGGVRVFYRHVDLLNESGAHAAVVHCKSGYRAGWFENDTRVIAGPDLVATRRDILVVPEFFGAAIPTYPSDGPRVVLFDQGPYYTFDGMSLDDARRLTPDRLAAILTVSDDAMEVLEYAFPGIPVAAARSVIDPALFFPGDRAPGLQIAYATNRREQECRQLLSLLALRGYANWSFVPIRGMSESEVARTLRESAIFLSFNDRDGFGLPPAEAMASGCFVIGYHGQGAREFFDPSYCQPIDNGDLLGFARAVESAMTSYEQDPAPVRRRGLTAATTIHARYTSSGLRCDLIGFYETLGAGPSKT